jgi:hypothetical protein
LCLSYDSWTETPKMRRAQKVYLANGLLYINF